jgi:tetratricopeptide (TPR) repeat protein
VLGEDLADCSRVTGKQTIGIITWLCLASPAFSGTPAAAKLRAEGTDHEYNLRLDQALSKYRQALDADPADPASYRAVAGIYMLKIAFERGSVTTDDFLSGDISTDTVEVEKPSAALANGFHAYMGKALELAEAQVRARPTDANAHYQLGTTIALLASYSATIDGQIFEAFKFARRAYREDSRALELDPMRRDAGVIIGLYQYLISIRSLPVRWIAKLGGIDSGKSKGVALVEAAADAPGESQTDARIALMVIYNRERRYDDALRVLGQLQARYPDNRLFSLEAGATLLRAGQYEDARRIFDAGLIKFFAKTNQTQTRAFGEEALWHYKRAAALVALGRHAEAMRDLEFAQKKEARGWVKARIHVELGKIADMNGNRAGAVDEYRAAVGLAKTANDSIGLAEAQRFLETPYSAPVKTASLNLAR